VFEEAEVQDNDDLRESQYQGVSTAALLAAGVQVDPCAQVGPLGDLQVDAEAGAAEVPSLRGFGEGRREILKRRAEVFTRSTCETFSFVTSKTLSQQDARDVLETFCNVSPSIP
jgi:hypothetical protein